MDRLDAMAIFIAAVDTGSLSGAGRKIGAPLPTVSRKLSDLEAHLGARLLVRSTRKLMLTDAGAGTLKVALEDFEGEPLPCTFSTPARDFFLSRPASSSTPRLRV